MTLEEKIGQLLIVGIEGSEISQDDKSQILNNKVGGFIFFSRNIDNKAQVLTLLNNLKDSNKDNKIPLFLSIDEEGGLVSRLSNIFENLVDVAQLGHKNNDMLSFDYGELQGLKLSSLGFNLNFAPVLDINSNPNNPVIGRRAIDSKPSIVAQQGIALIKGLQSSNIIAVAKHFPGHGDTDVDSHLELPLVDKSYEELEKLELIPFKAAIDNGVDMIMVAHILYPQIDDNYPASMSKDIINDILREKLKFNGVVISDDMTMGAIVDNYSLEEASLKFLQSGGDLLLVSHGVENPTIVINRIKNAINDDEINIEEIDELVSSIENLSNSVADSASKISKILTFAKVPIGVFEYEKDNGLVFFSQQMFELLGLKTIDEDYLYISASEFKIVCREHLKHLVNKDELIYKVPYKSSYRWLQMKYIDDGVRVLGVVTDITKDMLEKEKIEYELSFDALTNIFNRRAFEEKVTKLFTDTTDLKIGALLMCDLDNLKFINDTFGHDYGDNYIRAIAICLSKIDVQNCIAARRSGDEFYVFLYGFDSKEEIREIINRLWADISQTSIILPNGTSFGIKVSGGIAWYPDDSDSYSDLLRFSDFAMYSTKHSKKGDTQEFNHQAFSDNGFLVSGQGALNRIIDDELLNYVLQPIVSVQTGELYGFEMLMRATLPEFKNPEHLLRLASSQSKLYDIERLTWFKSLETCRKLLDNGSLTGNEKIFVNSISTQVLTDEHLAQLEEKYSDILKNVVIEFTESEKISDGFGRAKNKIAKRWGALTAIDDFGSGYNSESTLIFLSPHLVKIDISIVRSIDTDINRQTLFESIVKYTATRSIKIIAEGVETKSEMETVVRLGAHYIQGYYVAKPAFDIAPIPTQITRSIQSAYEKYKKQDRGDGPIRYHGLDYCYSPKATFGSIANSPWHTLNSKCVPIAAPYLVGCATCPIFCPFSTVSPTATATFSLSWLYVVLQPS